VNPFLMECHGRCVHVGAAQDAFLQDVVRLHTLPSLCCQTLLSALCTIAPQCLIRVRLLNVLIATISLSTPAVGQGPIAAGDHRVSGWQLPVPRPRYRAAGRTLALALQVREYLQVQTAMVSCILAAGTSAAEESTRRSSRVLMELLARQRQQQQQQQPQQQQPQVSVGCLHDRLHACNQSSAHPRHVQPLLAGHVHWRQSSTHYTMHMACAGRTAAAGRRSSAAGTWRPHCHCEHGLCHTSRLQASAPADSTTRLPCTALLKARAEPVRNTHVSICTI
jgi:hypothetical protein